MLLFLVACTPDPQAMRIADVSPGFAYNGETTTVQIMGENFFPSVSVGESINDAFRVELGNTSLSATLQDFTLLSLDIPAGLETGSYPLTVVAPSGLQATASELFDITDTRADHLSLRTTSAAYQVGEIAEVQIILQDPEDYPVTMPLEVLVSLESELETPGVGFESGLTGQEAVTDGITGWLGEDGTGVFRVTSIVPDNVRFKVQALDEEGTLDQHLGGAEQLLSWSPGMVGSLKLELEEGLEQAVAGDRVSATVTVLDAYGNPLPDEVVSILIFEQSSCDGALGLKDEVIYGSQSIFIDITHACESTQLAIYWDGQTLLSEPFEVLAGPADHLNVNVIPAEGTTVEAGVERATVVVMAEDAYENPISGYTSALKVQDTLGGLDSTAGVGTVSCTPRVYDQTCQVTMLVAGTNSIVVTGEEGASGISEAFEVLPSSPVQLLVDSPAGRVVAGEPFVVTVALEDTWGNLVQLDPVADGLSFYDDTGTILCEVSNEGSLQEALSAFCSVTRASSNDAIWAIAQSLESDSTVVEVVNAALAIVELMPGSLQLNAGELESLSLQGRDSWGNPYLIQQDPVVELFDTTGTLSPSSISLDASGGASLDFSITRSGSELVISAYQGGVLLGQSPVFEVFPGPTSMLSVETAPYLVVGEESAIQVRAVDSYGNTSPTFSGVGLLTASGGACPDTLLGSFEEGIATISLVCTSAVLAEVLEANANGLSGSTPDIDIVDLQCSDGPSAALLVDGAEEVTRCLVAGQSSSTLDASSSVDGGSPILIYHFSDSDATAVRSLASTETFSWETVGVRSLEVLVVDDRGCAALAEGTAWVGEDNGAATGPIDVVVASSSVANGASSSVTVTATDCAGDPANGTLLVAANLGDPDGIPSGHGLELSLSASGQATFDWVFSSGYTGLATLKVGYREEALIAYGEGTASVTGDSVRPFVVDIIPEGLTEDLSIIEVLFSEPIRPSSIDGSVFLQSGTSSSTISTTLSSDGTLLTITPLDSPSPLLVWTLSLSTGIRDDEQGNRLSGDWSGNATSFVTTLGTVGVSTPTITSCVPSVFRFVPDGDNSVDEDADSVAVSVTADATPVWWRGDILDEASELIWAWREDGSLGTVFWDGRALDGKVVAPGSYTVLLAPIDIAGNTGTACALELEIASYLGMP